MRRVPWAGLGALLACGLGWGLGGLVARGWVVLPACPFKAVTGLPCATCGLTRWGLALRAGDWHGAWHWHPAACLGLALLPALVLWDLRRAWRGEPYPPLPERPWARWSVAAALLATWAVQVARGI